MVMVRVGVRVRDRIGIRGHLDVEHLMGRLCVLVGETEPVVELLRGRARARGRVKARARVKG